MKRFKLISLFSLIISVFLCSCGLTQTSSTTTNKPVSTTTFQEVDYAGTVKLDMNSSSLRAEVTIKQTVDGDTTHFFINHPDFPEEVLKARYLAVNTPESTGKIEPYGKKASNFTKEKLLSATSIIIESDTSKWNADSTGDRYLVWVWYKTEGSNEYRNLNIELLQNGLAIASNSSQNKYGEICMKAINQANVLKLNISSGKQDPDFFYGTAIELTLKELRTNIEEYVGTKVAFECVIYQNENQSVYVEAYDEETDLYYGMSVYYGFGANGNLLDILTVGNKVRIVGSVSLYEAAGTYQVSGLSYNVMRPTHADNTQLIESGFAAQYKEYTAEEFATKTYDIEITDGETSEVKEFTLAELSLNSSISIKNLNVVDIYTTDNDGSSDGAMTITCESNGTRIKIRTTVLKDSNGNIVTKEAYIGKNISVKGAIEYYNGYQVKVFRTSDIIIND